MYAEYVYKCGICIYVYVCNIYICCHSCPTIKIACSMSHTYGCEGLSDVQVMLDTYEVWNSLSRYGR
jgi:hypothetical protein